MAATMTVVDAHLEMDPDDVIEFVLDSMTHPPTTDPPTTVAGTNMADGNATATDTSQRVRLTLKHPDADGFPIAFKVRRRSFVVSYFDMFYIWTRSWETSSCTVLLDSPVLSF
jgi:hypothetical protein